MTGGVILDEPFGVQPCHACIVRDTAENEVEEKFQSGIAAVLRQLGDQLIGAERLLDRWVSLFMIGRKKQIASRARREQRRRQHIFEAHDTAALQMQGPGSAWSG